MDQRHVEPESNALAFRGIVFLRAVAVVWLAAVAWSGTKGMAATQWPLQVSEDSRFFVQRDGAPYFPITDTAAGRLLTVEAGHGRLARLCRDDRAPGSGRRAHS
jgi:hypothetical protein